MLTAGAAGYLANGAVVMPIFGDAASDARAEADMRRHFPGRTVVPVTAHPRPIPHALSRQLCSGQPGLRVMIMMSCHGARLQF
jgi:hypothetical protein